VGAQGHGPTAGAQIVARQQGRQVAAAAPDANGFYSVALANGAYHIDVAQPAHSVPAALDITMAGAGQEREVPLQRLRID